MRKGRGRVGRGGGQEGKSTIPKGSEGGKKGMEREGRERKERKGWRRKWSGRNGKGRKGMGEGKGGGGNSSVRIFQLNQSSSRAQVA